jgi:hypothetical protein
MSATHTVLPGQDRAIQADLYMSLELGDKKWLLTLSDGRRSASRYSVEAGDTGAVMRSIDKARERFKVDVQAKVHSCYEAGRDGWWLHRWLLEQGIDNIVVDSASIEVSRQARRAKTDRLDGDKLHGRQLRFNDQTLGTVTWPAPVGHKESVATGRIGGAKTSLATTICRPRLGGASYGRTAGDSSGIPAAREARCSSSSAISTLPHASGSARTPVMQPRTRRPREPSDCHSSRYTG